MFYLIGGDNFKSLCLHVLINFSAHTYDSCNGIFASSQVRMQAYESKKMAVAEEKARRSGHSSGHTSSKMNSKLSRESNELEPFTIGNDLVLRHLWLKQAAIFIQQVCTAG